MAIPPGVTTCLVYKKAPVSFGGSSAKVSLEITPSVRLVHTATGTPLADFVELVTPAEGSVAQLLLPHSNQPGFQDEAGNAFTNWTYTAKVKYEKGGSIKHVPPQSFQLAQGQTEVDLSLIPSGPAALPSSAPLPTVTSVDGETGALDLTTRYATYLELARTPEVLITGTITRDANGAPTSAAVVWPDGTPGTFTGTPSAMLGALDGWAITYGEPATKTYTQPAVTRNGSGAVTNQPAIVLT
jgi:hypothetical protein